MATTYGPELTYRCFNDCRQEGCPGHTLRAGIHRTVDIIFFEIDGKRERNFDQREWKTMLRAWDALLEQERS